jgi:hypothetical protein
MTAMRSLTALILLVGSAGCTTTRPTVTGQIMYGRSGVGMGGVVVTIQESHRPEVLECAVTDWRGRFSLKGEQFGPIVSFEDRIYRVHAHRDDHYDLDYAFRYPVQSSSLQFFLREKDIGQLELIVRPRSASDPVQSKAFDISN